MSARLFVLVLVLGPLVPAAGWSQGLGDTAARERDKRAKQAATKKKPEPARVFTNADLGEEDDKASGKKGQESSGAARPPQTSGVSGGGYGESSPPDSGDQSGVDAAQRRVNDLEQRVKQLSDKLNPMSGSFIYGPTGSNRQQDEAETRSELTQVQAQLDQARQELATAQEGQGSGGARRRPSTPR